MAAAVKITRTDRTAAELCVLAAKSRDSAQSRRLLAIAMVLEGGSREDAARQAGMDRQTLRDWVHRYNEIGPDGLISRTAPGPQPRLNEAQMATLRDLVIAGPDAAIHGVVRWRCVDLRDEVARRFGVTVGEGTIASWLRKFGLTRLQPRPVHPKKDPAAEEAFKKTHLRPRPACGGRNGSRYFVCWRWSDRKVSGGGNPVKKHGPRAVARLRVVTSSWRSRSGS